MIGGGAEDTSPETVSAADPPTTPDSTPDSASAEDPGEDPAEDPGEDPDLDLSEDSARDQEPEPETPPETGTETGTETEAAAPSAPDPASPPAAPSPPRARPPAAGVPAEAPARATKRAAPLSRREALLAAPASYDVLALLRDLEADRPDLPRIGTAITLAQEIVILQQDPYMAFPDSNITAVDWPEGQPPRITQRFMGYFGALGPLPGTLVHEAWRWQAQRGDTSFARFADIFASRFVELLYRAWADPRPVVQAARPRDDRFRYWLGALSGQAGLTAAPPGPTNTGPTDSGSGDAGRLALHLTGLLASRVRSATRLRQMLQAWMGLDLEIVERAATWLEIDPAERSKLGAGGSLGGSLLLGGRVLSVSDRVMVVLHCRDLAEYETLLPGQPRLEALAAFLERTLGPAMTVDVRLTLPRPVLPATVLGAAGQLGWTSFAAPGNGDEADEGGQDRPARVACATFTVVPRPQAGTAPRARSATPSGAGPKQDPEHDTKPVPRPASTPWPPPPQPAGA